MKSRSQTVWAGVLLCIGLITSHQVVADSPAPDSGHTYRCKMTVIGNDKLEVRGFIGFALLGRTQTWTRYNSTTLDLPAAR